MKNNIQVQYFDSIYFVTTDLNKNLNLDEVYKVFCKLNHLNLRNCEKYSKTCLFQQLLKNYQFNNLKVLNSNFNYRFDITDLKSIIENNSNVERVDF
jgi:hypothetical protein